MYGMPSAFSQASGFLYLLTNTTQKPGEVYLNIYRTSVINVKNLYNVIKLEGLNTNNTELR